MISETQEQATTTPTNGLSQARLMIHIEGFAVFVSSILLYAHISGDWLAFVLLLFTPDASMVGYLINKQVGATLYNIIHTYSLPIVLILGSLAGSWQLGITLSLIWFAHIGMDRTVGYGLKYGQKPFSHTHLHQI